MREQCRSLAKAVLTCKNVDTSSTANNIMNTFLNPGMSKLSDKLKATSYISRDGGIWTHDLQHPMLARYQATLHPDVLYLECKSKHFTLKTSIGDFKQEILLKKQWKLSNGKMFPYFCIRFNGATVLLHYNAVI